MTVREKTREYPTKKGKRICRYVVFEKKVNGEIKQKYCGLSNKAESWIKAYTKEVAHLQNRFEHYLNALMNARDVLESYQESQEISPHSTEKNEVVSHQCPLCFNWTAIPQTQLLVFCPHCDFQFTNNVALEIGEGSS